MISEICRAPDFDGEFAERDLRAEKLRTQPIGEIGRELVKGVVHQGSRKDGGKLNQRSMVPVRLIFFCRRSTP